MNDNAVNRRRMGKGPADMSSCVLCPRRCGVDRTRGQLGYCRSTSVMHVARAALHLWEEPCISGKDGSGAVFFTGCNLRCRFCQNAAISGGSALSGDGSAEAVWEKEGAIAATGMAGAEVTPKQLSEIFLNLQGQGANNINLVTAGHYILPCIEALRMAKERGLAIPVVYNSSGYELPGTLRLLYGLVDIYLPDFKYMDPELAGFYSQAPDYPQTAMRSLGEMVRQIETRFSEGAGFDAQGRMTHGVIVRLLLLPGHVTDAKRIVEYLYRTYGDRIWISMMSQYTPMPAVREDPLLGRRVTRREYDRLVDYALSLGVTNAFIQEREVAKESFIPAFDGTGLSSVFPRAT